MTLRIGRDEARRIAVRAQLLDATRPVGVVDLVTRLNLPPFIVTLGTLSIFTAIGLLYSGGASVGKAQMPDILNVMGTRFKIGPFNLTLGVLVVIAAVQFDPAKANGLDPALKALAGQPYGMFLLAIVAVGLAAYGLGFARPGEQVTVFRAGPWTRASTPVGHILTR